ncbi:MAG: hypothetical protein ABL971_16025 [Vicinamibacterales bacterium]
MRTSLSTPKLSLILCSRNDSYMGNSRWRLQTALNYVAKNIEALGRDADVEILVTDWGSEVPLREVLTLTSAAQRLTSFIIVPPTTASELQGDSPFPEVLALNAAARRATGRYIGRIDQDTLVGRRFLTTFFEILDGTRQIDAPLLMGFSNVKMIPYRFSVQCPEPSSVELFVHCFGRLLKRENWHSRAPFYHAAVGIWLVHREVWSECGGYDERMIYMNSMETNMTLRLLPTHTMANLGELCAYDFYHLEHYHPWVPRRSRIYRKVNSNPLFSEPEVINPNGQEWGLREHRLEVLAAAQHTAAANSRGAVSAFIIFVLLMIQILPVMSFDWAGLSVRRQLTRLRNTWQLVEGRPVTAWPGIILARLKERRTRA